MFFPSSPHEKKTLQHVRIAVSRVGTASSPSGPTTTVGPRHLSPQVPSYRWRPTERDAQQHCLRESPAVSAWEMHSDVFFLCINCIIGFAWLNTVYLHRNYLLPTKISFLQSATPRPVLSWPEVPLPRRSGSFWLAGWEANLKMMWFL